jgi:hypothetical protein
MWISEAGTILRWFSGAYLMRSSGHILLSLLPISGWLNRSLISWFLFCLVRFLWLFSYVLMAWWQKIIVGTWEVTAGLVLCGPCSSIWRNALICQHMPTILFLHRKGIVYVPKQAPFYFSVLCSLLPCRQNFSVRAVPLLPATSVFCMDPRASYRCLGECGPPFSFCSYGDGGWSSAGPDNLIRVMESCDGL